MRPYFSIVSPVYRAENIIDKLVEEIDTEISKITDNFEIILVEDCGPDNSWDKIVENCHKNPRVRGIKLSRNFGQQYALNAGLDASRGEWIITMDCDLQDQPSEIHKMYAKAQEGYEIILASREDRQDDFLKKFFSQAFYKVMSYLTDTHQDPSVANFVLYNRKAVDALKKLNDYNRYYPMMLQWVGFKRIKVPIQHAEREDGHSSYSFKARVNLAIETMLSFSDKPLRLTVQLGLVISLISVIFGIRSILIYMWGEVAVEGWTSLILTISFFSGLIISILGMIGLYIGKIFESVKNRPTYIVSQEVGAFQASITEKTS